MAALETPTHPEVLHRRINPAMYERRGGEDEMFRTILGYIVILVPTEQ